MFGRKLTDYIINKTLTLSVMRFIWKHIKKHKRLLFIALALATINQVFSLLDPIVFRYIVDTYASNASKFTTHGFFIGVLGLIVLSVSVALISRVAKTFQEYYVSNITQRVGAGLYEQSVGHTFSLPYGIFEDRRSGEILQKLQKARLDTQTVIESMISIVFLSLIGMIFVIIYAFTVNWLVGVTFILIIPALGSATFVISKRIKAAQKSIVLETAELAGSTTETIRNVELVKALGLEDQEIKRLNIVNNTILHLELKKIKLIRTLNFIQGTLINAMRAILLIIMLFLIHSNSITLGELFSLFIFSFYIFSPLGSLGTTAAQYQEAKASNEALDEILDIKPEKEPKNAKVVGPLKEITYKNVSFTYPSSKQPALEKVQLTIQRGKTVAFVGASGSGKSTLAKILVGLYKPSKGEIQYNGVPHTALSFENIRSRIGLVLQETQLFAGTVRENLLFVRSKATDEECIAALRAASVTRIIERGGKGLDTKIGEGGIKLSGGEKQRLAIARALLRKPELLIFDEATSSLDSITESEITETIKNIRDHSPGLIVVLIAHRLSTITHADTIFVLERGSVIETGSHETLVAKKGLYYAFWRQQSGSENGMKRKRI